MTLTQRSTEWRLMRCGDVTASRFKDVMTGSDSRESRVQQAHAMKAEKFPDEIAEVLGVTTKTVEGYLKDRPVEGHIWSQTNWSYLEEKIAELITGQPQDRFRSEAIDHGNFYESVHREAAEVELRERFGADLLLAEDDKAYIEHPTEPHIGFSPDYVVGDDAGGEMKCPWNPKNHVAFIRGGVDWFMKQHGDQVYGGMWVKNLSRYYVSSFHPSFPRHLQLVMFEVDRNESYIRKLAPRVLAFRDLVLDEYQRITGSPF